MESSVSFSHTVSRAVCTSTVICDRPLIRLNAA
jgi:hypothetical protein